MLTKIKHQYKRVAVYVAQLRDIRVIGLFLFAIIVFMITWSGVKVIDSNYRLQRQIARLQQENELQRLKNENLRLENEYFDTEQYLDVAARESFGLAAPGEAVLIVPERVALKYTVELPHEPESKQPKAADQRPVYQRNFQAWMDFFLNRRSSSAD